MPRRREWLVDDMYAVRIAALVESLEERAVEDGLHAAHLIEDGRVEGAVDYAERAGAYALDARLLCRMRDALGIPAYEEDAP